MRKAPLAPERYKYICINIIKCFYIVNFILNESVKNFTFSYVTRENWPEAWGSILHTPGFNLSQSIIFWVEVRVQSINLISATCNGLCCSPETEEQLRHQARADFHDLIHHHSRSLQGLLATTADALRGKSTLFYCHKWSDCTLSYGTLNLRSHGERHSETGKTIRAKMYVCNGWLIDSLIIDNLVAMVASRIDLFSLQGTETEFT